MDGLLKATIEKSTQRILGCTILAAEAGEMIGTVQAVMTRKCNACDYAPRRGALPSNHGRGLSMRFLRLSEPPPRPGCMYAPRLDHDELSRFDGPTCRRTRLASTIQPNAPARGSVYEAPHSNLQDFKIRTSTGRHSRFETRHLVNGTKFPAR